MSSERSSGPACQMMAADMRRSLLKAVQDLLAHGTGQEKIQALAGKSAADRRWAARESPGRCGIACDPRFNKQCPPRAVQLNSSWRRIRPAMSSAATCAAQRSDSSPSALPLWRRGSDGIRPWPDRSLTDLNAAHACFIMPDMSMVALRCAAIRFINDRRCQSVRHETAAAAKRDRGPGQPAADPGGIFSPPVRH